MTMPTYREYADLDQLTKDYKTRFRAAQEFRSIGHALPHLVPHYHRSRLAVVVSAAFALLWWIGVPLGRLPYLNIELNSLSACGRFAAIQVNLTECLLSDIAENAA
jgi:hypothetical protein